MARFHLEDIGLTYTVYNATDQSVRSAVRTLATGGFIRRTGSRRVEIQALDGVTLTAEDGDRIGIIGHNGSGKTTLLKVIAGIYKPQRGAIRREGKTVAVINPGVGLNQTLSGRENIENIALLAGLSWAEIAASIPEIEEFTELGDFLKLPVHTYSSGMQTRLAFGVATALQPDILVADENLGTGDARFIERAQERMKRMMDRSSILVLASHSLSTIRQLCNRAILMEHGQIVSEGPVEDVVSSYKHLAA